MTDIQIFNNPEFGTVRTLEEDNGVVLFCASDVAKALGYTNAPDAVSRHCRAIVKRDTPISGKIQEINFIPSIRKHGAYMTPETLQAAILNPDTMIQLCQQLKAEQDKNAQLIAVNSQLTVDKQIMQPKADYFDELVDRNLLTNFRETAKQFGVKEKPFIQFLLDKKYIYRDKKGKLMPYAEKNNGLFEVKECFNEKTQWSGTQTLVTPKGRETFRLLYL